MASEKSSAIVLRVTEFSETSCIVNLMTRDFGRITAIAKGARRLKSPFEAAIDVLAICQVVFIHKMSAMSILTEAKLDRRFRSAAVNLKRLYMGYYVVELLQKLTDEGDPCPELFDLTRQMLVQLDQLSFSENDLNHRLLQYELGLLDLTGHLPMLTRCVSCGREKTQITDVNFGLNAGGVLCNVCRRGQVDVVKVDASVFAVLLDVAGAQLGSRSANSDNWNGPNTVKESLVKYRYWGSADISKSPTTHLRDVRELVGRYIAHLLGFAPRTAAFLKQV